MRNPTCTTCSAAIRWALLVLACLLTPQRALAVDEFGDEYTPPRFELRSGDLTLVFKGELELEFHDLEGEGGPGFDSPTDTRTLGTRSPFVELDSFSLALRLGIGEHVWINSALDFDTRDARVGAVFFDYRERWPSWLEHHLELGYQVPLVHLDRRTERYPLIATIYWRQPELHLLYDLDFELAVAVSLQLGASVAMMRPLGFAGVQESSNQAGTINVLAYDLAEPYSGNSPVAGGRLGVRLFGAFVEAFGFIGKLSARGGTDVLISGFPAYRELPGFGGDSSGGDFAWMGGRAGFVGFGANVFAEFIYSTEDLLDRWGFYVQAGYRLELLETWLRAVEPIVRYEQYRLLDSTRPLASGNALRSVAPINAASWDFDVLTLALRCELYRDLLVLRFEYYLVDEANGVPALGIDDAPLDNDELLIQAELRF